MGFKIGDKVRAKSWEEIEKTLDSNGYCHGMYFKIWYNIITERETHKRKENVYGF